MRWEGRRQSENVEDRRTMRAGRLVAGGGGLGLLLVLVLALIFKVDPRPILQQMQPAANGGAAAPGEEVQLTPEQQKLGEFASTVLADTEDVWTAIFERAGRRYENPKMVLFTGQVQSACGMASAAVGPFYCPGDRKLYVDLSFFEELAKRFQAPGDFAQAYVIAHEVGHHVQNLLGTMDEVNAQRRVLSEKDFNELSVRLELQADFYAGVWAHHADKMFRILERGDIEEGLRAANAIGDDKIQMQAQGYVVPDAFTHGSAEQRVRWFRKGLETGDMSQGDTFGAQNL